MRFAYIQKPLTFVLGVCVFVWAIGFASYFDHWVFFPAFPNAFGSIGMGLVGGFLLYEALGKSNRIANMPDVESRSILFILDDIDSIEES